MIEHDHERPDEGSADKSPSDRSAATPPTGPRLSLTELSDDELAGAAAVGDQEAFGVLIARVSPMLLRYLQRMADPVSAEDLAQETLLSVWKGLPDFDFRSSFRTWMFTIAYRRLADSLRKKRDVPTDETRFVDLESPEPLPAEVAMGTSLLEALRTELDGLPPTSRSTWWLREVEGLSLAEIARVLQISTGSARGHLQRSRRYLATRLAPWRPGSTEHMSEPDSTADGASS
ncbi:RNA polymerase sigma factor [Williamsia muralis]|uniref:RNA polymerase sigma factor n=1 Tax=Williamsia marianensis TaxID=85044 RepID=UPI000DE6A363|nr:sigma-70 family RNA polymerase sigma factor [Williamsia marianensis]PVY30095.1 RNA polymerase sigma-70 factor (ECF subfamily) [Williamsia marianensis]